MEQYIGILGIAVLIGIAYFFSTDRSAIKWRIVGGGLLLQFLLAFIILRTDFGKHYFQVTNDLVLSILNFTDEGSQFVFGTKFTDFFVAFKVLPTIIFFSSVSYLLFHWGLLQKVVEFLAFAMQKILGVSGSESLAAAANIFCGQTEAPLLIRPYLISMTRSELHCMMSGGMATIAGGVMAAFVGMGFSAGHLLAASVMSAPAAIMFAKLFLPETEQSQTAGEVKIAPVSDAENSIDAACKGASEGLKLALNVAAMLIAFIALVAMFNAILGSVTGWFGFPITFQELLGYICQPFAWLMGVPWEESHKAGQLLGEKTILNEFLAYAHLAEMKTKISERTFTIMTYALCGFANFSSIAIQIGGIGSLVPERKQVFAQIGLKAMVAGTFAAFSTACIAGILL